MTYCVSAELVGNRAMQNKHLLINSLNGDSKLPMCPCEFYLSECVMNWKTGCNTPLNHEAATVEYMLWLLLTLILQGYLFKYSGDVVIMR